MKQNWRILLIFALIALAVFYLVPTGQFYGMSPDERKALDQNSPAKYYDLASRAIKLGLDLQGGIHLVLEVKTEGMEPVDALDAVDRAQEVIRNRIDQYGVAEPIIQRQGTNRIIIELPGEEDVERAKNLIGQTALLEFQLLEPYDERDRLLQRLSTVLTPGKEDSSAAGQDSSAAEEEAKGLFDEVGEEAAADLFEDEPQNLLSMLGRYGNDVTVSNQLLNRVRSMLGEQSAQNLIPSEVEFVFSSKPEGPPGNQFHYVYLVRKRPEMIGSIVQDAQVSIGQSVENMGQPIVNFTTTEEGIDIFKRVSGAHIGERLAIVLDGAVYSAPTIQDQIRNGRSVITGSGTQEEAQDLAIVLRAGALPAEVEVIEDRTVGPSLGRDSIEQGRTATLISMVAVAVFMLLYYQGSGIIAVIALSLNLVFVMATLAGFQATLTLPGIAGIILTIGMAVDANVLIFERIREELRSGKTVRAAIESGYNNALSAIIDANLTTLMVGIVLYEFGTGPIRGFALTLMVGIVSSLFTAFFVTRALFELITRRTQARSLSIGPVKMLAGLKIRFLEMRKFTFVLSGVVLAAGVISLGAINGLKTGIDFSGGTLLELHFDPPLAIEDIRAKLRQVQVEDRTLDLSSSEIKQFGSPNDILIRITEEESGTDVADGIKATLKAGFGSNISDELEWVRRQEKVGPKIGAELSDSAIRAVLLSLALILVYMAWRFHRFLYGIAAVAALAHDVLITLGLLSLLNIEVTLAVVAAILAIVGYSLNDTIVVFDRVRENLRTRARDQFGGLLNTSINECLSRTLVTSVTTMMAVLVLMIWGGEVIRDFTTTLLIGVIVGTYSSIFVASPVLFYGNARAESKESKNKS